MNNKLYVIYGAGKMGKVTFEYAKALNISVIGFVDKNTSLQNSVIQGIKVISPCEMASWITTNHDIGVLIGSSDYDEEIYTHLRSIYGNNINITKFHDFQKCYISEKLSEHRQNALSVYKIDYNNQIENWVNGLMSEVEFWAKGASSTGTNHESYLAREKEANGNFICDRLRYQLSGSETVIDAGCGIFSLYGRNVDNGIINIIGVDPLAYFYNEINKRSGVNIPSEVRFGMFEFMSLFVKEKADIVLIDNALDHCIDPFKSIVECLKVLKVGGVLSTKHRRCEAEYEGYEGLHKWNIDLNEHKDFIIWNEKNSINVTKALKEYVKFDIEIYKLNGDDMLVIQMTNKKEIPIDLYSTDGDNCVQLANVVEQLLKKFSDDKMNVIFANLLENI